MVPAVRAQSLQVCTSLGHFTIELEQEAPAHVANFLRLVDSGFYNGTIVHRVVGDRIVQGGAYDRAFIHRPAGEPVMNESANGLKNARGTVAAARLRDPDSATSQFFVNLTDSSELDGTARRPGYTVFGRVTGGLAVLDAIGDLPTGPAGPLPAEVPSPIVVIEAITRISTESDETVSGDVLAEVTALRAGCAPVPTSMLVAEAEAALTRGLVQRARYALDNYFVVVDSSDPDIPRAQALFRRLPRTEQAGIAPLVAHCLPAVEPMLPDGRDATLADMERAQTAVRGFIARSEAYLECLAEVIDGGSLDDVQEVAAVGTHNEIVARMERMAEEFNRQLRAYRSRN